MSFSQVSFSTSGLTVAFVPTGPDIFPTFICFIECFNLSSDLLISSAHNNNFKPRVIGSACMPCVLPIITVFLFSKANWLNKFFNFVIWFNIILDACKICKLVEVSQISLVVNP